MKRFWAAIRFEVPIGNPEDLANHITTMPISSVSVKYFDPMLYEIFACWLYCTWFQGVELPNPDHFHASIIQIRIEKRPC